MFDEPMSGFNPHVDANALALPPVPAAYYLGNLSFLDSCLETRWLKDVGTTHRWARLLFEIIEGPHRGRQVFSSVSTRPRPGQSRPSSVIELIQAMGQLRKGRKTPAFLMRLLNQALQSQSGAICHAFVDWKPKFWNGDPKRNPLRHVWMANFPIDADGNHIPEWTLTTGDVVPAQNVIRLWKRLPPAASRVKSETDSTHK